MQNYQYELLIASNSIIINSPLQDTWKKLTQPDFKYTWISNTPDEPNQIFSNWKTGDDITWQYFNSETKSFHDYYRGTIIESDENKSITFLIHSAIDEEISIEQKDEQPDIHEEEWKIQFEPNGNVTKLTLSKSDFDYDHNSDDEHDHEAALKTCKEGTEKFIPQQLLQIKKFCEES